MAQRFLDCELDCFFHHLAGLPLGRADPDLNQSAISSSLLQSGAGFHAFSVEADWTRAAGPQNAPRARAIFPTGALYGPPMIPGTA